MLNDNSVKQKNTIPRIIHQIWMGPLEPPKSAMDSWRDLHPSWEVRVWNEQNLPSLKNKQAFADSDNYPQKSDILRYEILSQFGGVYVDADEYCLRPIDPLIDLIEKEGFDLAAAYEGSLDRPELIANTVLACSVGNEFMGKMVENIDIERDGGAWELTGPQYLTDQLAFYKPQIKLLSSKLFYPIHHRDKENRQIDLSKLKDDPEIYGVHLWAGTKRAYRPIWYKEPHKYLHYIVRKSLNKTFQIKEP